MNTSVSYLRNKEVQHVWQQRRLQQGTAVISMLMCFPTMMMMMVHHQPWWPSFSDNLLGTDFTSTLLLLTVFSLGLIVNKTTVLIIICSLHPACAQYSAQSSDLFAYQLSFYVANRNVKVTCGVFVQLFFFFFLSFIKQLICQLSLFLPSCHLLISKKLCNDGQDCLLCRIKTSPPHKLDQCSDARATTVGCLEVTSHFKDLQIPHNEVGGMLPV